MSETKSKAKKATTSTVPAGEATPIIKGSHVYLVDGSGYIFRAFHALPPLTRPSDGLPVGAVHGFCAMLWKLLRELKASEAPTHLAVVFDASRDTFRNVIYDQYKANRPPPPDELVPQFALIRDAVKAFNVACIELEGFEADDLIASYAREIVDAGGDVTIVSSDKDLMQLVRPGVVMLDAMKAKKIGRDEVIEKFGVPPDKVVDVQSLAGDSTDNVPGVPGIGVKTAAELIKEYGDLDALLARAGEIKQPKRREKLIEFADQARVSRELVRLKDDVPDMIPADALGVHDPDPAELLGFLRVMEFNTLTRRIAEGLGAEPPAPVEVSVGSTVPTKGRAQPGVEKAKGEPVVSESPAAGAAEAAAAARAPFDRSKYETVTTREHLEAWIMKAYAAGRFAFDTETTSIDPMVAELVGFSMAVAPGEACYVPLGASRQLGQLRFRHARRHRADSRRRSPGAAEAAARGAVDPQDRPEHQVRPQRAGAARHQGGAARRHDADVVRARCRQGRARHGRPRHAPPWPCVHLLRPGHRARARQEVRAHVRPGAARQGD